MNTLNKVSSIVVLFALLGTLVYAVVDVQSQIPDRATLAVGAICVAIVSVISGWLFNEMRS